MTQQIQEIKKPEEPNKNGAFILAVKGNKFLFTKSFRGFWELPGGGIDDRSPELPCEAAIRELFEEARVRADIRDLRQIGTFGHRIPRSQDSEGKYETGLTHFYELAKYDLTVMGLGEEVTEVKFLSEREILEAFEKKEFSLGALRMFGHYLNLKRSGNLFTGYVPEARLSQPVTFTLAGKTIMV